MLVWNDKKKLDDTLLLLIEEEIGKNYIEKNKYFTSFNDSNDSFVFLRPFYSELVDNIMNKLGMYHISKYEWGYWIQMYNSQTDYHTIHNHFMGYESISWVHFIKTTDKKYFYFLGENGNKVYPENQHTGDLIIYPSYLFHGVDQFTEENENRIVVAGNIILRSIDSVDGSPKVFSNKIFNTVIWTSIDNNSHIHNV